ncbi:uncharacterized protein H6S33_007970 [Morchella sextelata]|uniref:uncharacterized protein n=1 Tax=Morchella sextelata TaxID=1174677 RepID=UPI001D054E3A|nr:uncharacterized protein H6S33_007970 [Morchella sextelata]KAH0602966.1 hypothetical protein H6S33_007970 [Morchella sextelata]
MSQHPLTAYKTDLAAHLAMVQNMIRSHQDVYAKAVDEFNAICDKYPRGNYRAPSMSSGMEIRFDLSNEEFLRGVHVAFLKGCMDWHGKSVRALQQRLGDVNVMEEAREMFGVLEEGGEKEGEEGVGWVEVGEEEEKGKGEEEEKERAE